MTDTFYLLQMLYDNLFKFGMCRDIFEKRLAGYSGLNTPEKVITNYKIEQGFLEEHYFKEFLRSKNIDIVIGNEYFRYMGDIEMLLLEFLFIFDRDSCRTRDQKKKQVVDENNRKHIIKQKSMGKIFHCNICQYSTDIKGNIPQHKRGRKHLDRIKDIVVDID
jgi:hypothetical protein